MRIYADVLFLINFCMDYLILWVLSKVTSCKTKWFRILLGAAFMALTYCVMVFLPALNGYLNIFASVIMVMLGVVITFKPSNVKQFLKLVVLAHVVAASVGGVGMALFYLTDIKGLLGNITTAVIGNFSIKILVFTSCTAYILIKCALAWYKRVVKKKQLLYPITILCGDDSVNIMALLDTGNSLQDPLSNSPVIVAEFMKIKELLPDKVKLIFFEKSECNLLSLNAEDEFSKRLRMIPFTSVGKAQGVLVGFRPDKITIEYDGEQITSNDVIIGIYNSSLCENGAYHCLLNPQVISAVN